MFRDLEDRTFIASFLISFHRLVETLSDLNNYARNYVRLKLASGRAERMIIYVASQTEKRESMYYSG